MTNGIAASRFSYVQCISRFSATPEDKCHVHWTHTKTFLIYPWCRQLEFRTYIKPPIILLTRVLTRFKSMIRIVLLIMMWLLRSVEPLSIPTSYDRVGWMSGWINTKYLCLDLKTSTKVRHNLVLFSKYFIFPPTTNKLANIFVNKLIEIIDDKVKE